MELAQIVLPVLINAIIVLDKEITVLHAVETELTLQLVLAGVIIMMIILRKIV